MVDLWFRKNSHQASNFELWKFWDAQRWVFERIKEIGSLYYHTVGFTFELFNNLAFLSEYLFYWSFRSFKTISYGLEDCLCDIKHLIFSYLHGVISMHPIPLVSIIKFVLIVIFFFVLTPLLYFIILMILKICTLPCKCGSLMYLRLSHAKNSRIRCKGLPAS